MHDIKNYMIVINYIILVWTTFIFEWTIFSAFCPPDWDFIHWFSSRPQSPAIGRVQSSTDQSDHSVSLSNCSGLRREADSCTQNSSTEFVKCHKSHINAQKRLTCQQHHTASLYFRHCMDRSHTSWSWPTLRFATDLKLTDSKALRLAARSEINDT